MEVKLSNWLKRVNLIIVMLLSGCTVFDAVNTVSKVYPVNDQRDIPFGRPEKRLSFDLYYPQEPNKNRHHTPVIVFFYGGSWNSGDKSDYEFVGRRLASMGFIVALPNYRLYPTVQYPDFLNDSAEAIQGVLKQLRAKEFHPYRPSQKVFLMGHSAGAYNAAMLSLDDRWLNRVGISRQHTIAGFIGLAGAYNIYPIKVEEVKPVFHHPNYPSNSQPIDHAAQSEVPTLLLVPEKDTVVSIEKNTITLDKALRDNNTQSTVITIKGTGHASIIGTLSPVLLFKGSSATPIKQFIDSVTAIP